MNENLVSVRVWGDFACFTRPEMKVERVSYSVMTPSAARGVLEAIFWEPEVLYLVDSIRVVRKGSWVSFLRNEVTKVLSLNNISAWMKDPSRFDPVCAGGGARDGTQRNMLALEDVEYIITADMGLTAVGQRSDQKLRKYLEEFKRRASHGKCFHRPSLGMREFSADFEWEDDPQAALERRAVEIRPDAEWRNIWPHEELGLMLYDLFDHHGRRHGFRWLPEHPTAQESSSAQAPAGVQPKRGRKKAQADHAISFDGNRVSPQAVFFRAVVKSATMECHPDRVLLVGQTNQED